MPAETLIKAEELLLQQQAYCLFTSGSGWNSFLHDNTISRLSSQIAWEHNSGDIVNSLAEGVLPVHNSFNMNRQFIQLEKSFHDQIGKYPDVFDGKPEYLLQERMKISAEAMLKCAPDKVSLEITDEGSVFYTFPKDDARIYFQHFLVEDDEEMDEALVTIYKGDDKVLNYAGSLTDTIKELHSFFIPKAIAIPDLVP